MATASEVQWRYTRERIYDKNSNSKLFRLTMTKATVTASSHSAGVADIDGAVSCGHLSSRDTYLAAD